MRKFISKYFGRPVKSGCLDPMRELLQSEKIFKCSDCEKFAYCTELSTKFKAENVCKACERLREVKTMAKET